MKDIMIDLETLGIRWDAPIVSIGAAYFDPATGEVGETFYQVIDWIDDQPERPLDRSTVAWWLKQERDAQIELVRRTHSVPLIDALNRFDIYHKDRAKVWANGATFDITILDHAYQTHAGRLPPWHFRDIRDCRTIRELAEPMIDYDAHFMTGVAHNALDDALHQIRWTSAAWQALRGINHAVG